MIKIQVQAYGNDFQTKYTSYMSTNIPAIGDTLKIAEHRFTVTSVTWFVPENSKDDVVDQVHVSAEKQE